MLVSESLDGCSGLCRRWGLISDHTPVAALLRSSEPLLDVLDTSFPERGWAPSPGGLLGFHGLVREAAGLDGDALLGT
eukprot:9874524-Lingulodinium_polyedra.AAC.1